MRIVGGTHYFVEFFSWPDANDFLRQVGRNCRRQIDHLNRRNLGYENLAPLHACKVPQNELDALLQSNPKAGHAHVRNWQVLAAIRYLPLEKGDDRAA